jgi:hypothetical protein
MFEDRQQTGAPGGDAAHLLVEAARRHAVALDDLFLPDAHRLDERLRTTVRALLGKYVRVLETDLRAALLDDPAVAGNEALAASLSAVHVQIALPLLERTEALRDLDLIAVLARRAEEHRFMGGAAADGSLLTELVGDSDPAVSAQAMAALVAQSRRFDRFREPVLARTELPADLQHRLVWTIAASLRAYMVERHGFAPAAADRALAAAAARLLAGYDEGDTLEARAARLAQVLAHAGRLSDAMIVRAIEEGNLPLFAALLAARTGIAAASIWDIAIDGIVAGAALLMRAAEIDRDAAAQILIRLLDRAPGAPLREAELEGQVNLYDVTAPDEARDALALWRLDPAYRAALARQLAARAA